MDEKDQDYVLAFDTLFTTNRIQIMKALLPYFDPAMQKHLAVYIKCQELQYTISYFQKHPYQICAQKTPLTKESFHKISAGLLPYCNEAEKKQVLQMEQLFGSMEMYQEIMQAAELMKELMPEGEGTAGNTDGQPNAAGGFSMDMLMELLSPEQKNMFEMLKGGMDL